ncbi:MAG: Fic family protein [Desulfamplus sp.]|nr:Fic family protein [Desulfamplus sp.]
MNKPLPNRQSIRLKNYDYSQPGYYFITICTQERIHRFGKIIDEKMRLNDAGKIVADELEKTPIMRKNIQLDEWIIMPNHFHAIIFVGARCTRPMTDNRMADNGMKTEGASLHPIERAARVHADFVKIHPFSQIPALQLLIGLGFEFLTQSEALRERQGRTSNVLLESILFTAKRPSIINLTNKK